MIVRSAHSSGGAYCRRHPSHFGGSPAHVHDLGAFSSSCTPQKVGPFVPLGVALQRHVDEAPSWLVEVRY